MLLIIGWIIVTAAVVVGFLISGGRLGSLFVLGEYLIIGGVAVGYVCASSPPAVLKSMVQKILQGLKGSPYSRNTYQDLIKALYELFMIAREQGMVGIEEHMINPETSSIFKKYPSFLANHHAVTFLQDNLRPIIDGKIKGEQVKAALLEQLDRIHDHHARPLSILSKLGDAMPGVGIVAAVMGVIITMGSIGGDKAEIGHHVASALTGTFLGILLSYGFIQPMITNLEFIDADELGYYTAMSSVIISYSSGAAPIMAAESGRQAIPADNQITSEELEAVLKSLSKK